ncbi:hypothetical protein [Alloacidobacterium sp.]|uniref:hypothetical protein n=1 Tax=Alloacidobacterium sp. TaxID=2951999 RepID=UPI002D653BD7|nr:hypothetical protein [Alloacidobacterium sp.]HYK35674.1 hypothetical protein [Alloacidobacterium sp.]
MQFQTAIEHVNHAIGIVDPGTQLVEGYKSFLNLPAPPPTLPTNNLRDWCLDRVQNLCGAKSFGAALKNLTFKSLLAFGYMGFASDPGHSVPPINPYARVSAQVAKLEPDFFPVLAKKIQSESKSSPAFAARLKNAQTSVTHLVTDAQGDARKT